MEDTVINMNEERYPGDDEARAKPLLDAPRRKIPPIPASEVLRKSLRLSSIIPPSQNSPVILYTFILLI
jgi:hypothetical protein